MRLNHPILYILFIIFVINVFNINAQQCKDVAMVKTVASRAHWHHDDVELMYGNADDYRLVKRLGEGSYGEAYFAFNAKENYHCVIKIYKEKMSHSKMMRELLIMQNLCGGPNIIKMYDVVKEGEKGLPAVVIEHVNFTDNKTLFPQFSDRDVRFYMRNLLKAMEHMHRHDVIHRDIKPSNILIDPGKKILRLIDFGISRFHYHGANHTNGGTLNYIAPEILLGHKKYNPKVDIWSFGAMLAGIIFKREIFFKGDTHEAQLLAYTNVLGTEGLINLADRLEIEIDKNTSYFKEKANPKKWESFKTPAAKGLVSPEAIHVLESVLKFDPSERLSATELLKLPYFLV